MDKYDYDSGYEKKVRKLYNILRKVTEKGGAKTKVKKCDKTKYAALAYFALK